MAKMTEVVFIGKDNSIDLQLYDDTVVPGTWNETSLPESAKVEVVIDNGNKYNSTDHPTLVSFTITGKVSLKLGTCFTIENTYDAQLVVYDDINTNGVIWEQKIILDVKTDIF